MQHARIPDRPRSEHQEESKQRSAQGNTKASFASATPPIPCIASKAGSSDGFTNAASPE